MHIASIQISNFRGIEKFECNFGPVALLYGPNGAGKTTVLDAIRFVLTGVVRDQAGAGIELKRLVGPWGDRALVCVTLTDGKKHLKVTVKFNATKSALETDPPLPGKAAEQRLGIWSYFGLDPKRERLALDPLALLLGDDLLVGLSGDTNIDQKKLAGLFGKQWDKTHGLLSKYKLAIRTTSDVERVGDALYDLRTKVNRQVKTLAATLEQNVVTQPTTKKGTPLTAEERPKIEAKIQSLLHDRNAVMERLGQAGRGRSQAEIDADIAQADQAVREHTKNRPMVALEPAYPEKPSDYVSATDLLALKEAWDTARAAVLALGDGVHEDVCPTCKRALDEETINALKQGISEAHRKHAQAKGEYGDAEKIYRASEAYQAKCDEIRKNWERANAQAKAEWEAKDRQLKQALAVLRKEVAATETPESLKEEYERIQRTMEEGQELLTKLDAWLSYQRDKADCIRLEQESEFITWTLGILRDPASKKALGEDESSAFEENMNDIMNMFGYQIRCNWADSVIEMSELGDDRWRTLSEVSAGELTLAQVAVADAYGGEGLALIDRFEGVDAENSATVWNLLRFPVGGRVLAQTADTIDVRDVCCVKVG